MIMLVVVVVIFYFVYFQMQGHQYLSDTPSMGTVTFSSIYMQCIFSFHELLLNKIENFNSVCIFALLLTYFNIANA